MILILGVLCPFMAAIFAARCFSKQCPAVPHQSPRMVTNLAELRNEMKRLYGPKTMNIIVYWPKRPIIWVLGPSGKKLRIVLRKLEVHKLSALLRPNRPRQPDPSDPICSMDTLDSFA